MGGLTTFRQKVHRILDAEARDSTGERAANVFLAGLIILNVGAVMLETVPALSGRFGTVFAGFEGLSVAVFTVEYLLRLWSCTEDPRFPGTLRGRARFILTPLSLVDLLAILPAYLAGDASWDFRYVRALRLVRMLRVLKVARYSRALKTFGHVFREKRDELGLVGLFSLLLLVLASSSMYFAEHEAQPKAFSSIPASMWWAVMTLTTVGYGDVYPITPWGKVLGAIIALIGVGFFALPAGILAAAFAQELAKRRAGPRNCPHCGKELPDLS